MAWFHHHNILDLVFCCFAHLNMSVRFYFTYFINSLFAVSKIYLEHIDPLVAKDSLVLHVGCSSCYQIYHNLQLAFSQTFYHIRKGFVGMISGYFHRLFRHQQHHIYIPSNLVHMCLRVLLLHISDSPRYVMV